MHSSWRYAGSAVPVANAYRSVNAASAPRLSSLLAKRWADPLLWVALLAGPLVCGLTAYFPGVAWSPGRVLNTSNAVVTLGLIVVIYPVLEEWLFRGNLQPWLAE